MSSLNEAKAAIEKWNGLRKTWEDLSVGKRRELWVETFGVREAALTDGHGRHYYPQGVWHTDDQPVIGRQYRVPTDEKERLENVVTYRELALSRATDEFKTLKHRLLGTVAPNPEGLKQLKVLAQAVRLYQLELGDARELLAPMLPGYRTPEQIAEADRRAAELQSFKNEVEAVGRADDRS